ncbi:MAG: fibronectin type III domain-containing protein [Oscillospiraceae bacterium]|nr:fibronectin type III domain-containing protein [Oscillospiraceae bacterium]
MQVGTYYIKVTGIGNYIGSRVIPFVVSAQDDALSISVEPNVYQYTGSPIEPQNITVKYDSIVISEGYELEYYYDAQCTNPIDIENDGYPTVTGTYYIKAVGTGAHQNCTPGIASYTITGTPITKDGITVTLDERSFTYTGEGIKPSVTIMDGDTLLTEGVDYRLVYTNNINVGEGTITIYGIGGYIESRDETFVIGQSSDANAEVIGEYSYTGSEITAAVIVKNSSGAMLINGRDYTVEYSDNVNAGTASAVVSGAGNYSFTSDTLSYTIEKYTNKLFVSADNIHYTFDNESHTPQLTVTDIYGNTLTSEDYTVKYYTDSACVNEAEETVKTGVYYVKVNGTGVNYDSKASGVTAYMIIPSDHILTVTPSADDKVYNGSAYTAADFISEVAGESSVLTEADYDLYFADDASSVTDAASYVIIVLGKGNYDGFAGIVAVNVQPKDIASDDVVIDSLHSLTYTGGELKPDISINDSIGQLLQSRDYALDYADNIEIGTAKITVSGIGNYTGSREVRFDITSNNVNSMNAVLSGEYVYNGQPYEPKPTVTSNGTELTEGVDYVLTYKNNTNAGVASVTVTGIGNYAGTEIPISFYISARDIAEVTAELTSDAIYTGDTVTPVIKLTFDGTELIEGVDYIASYSNNVNAGVANVTVVGMGNYKNLKTNLSFNITESTEANVPSAPQVSLEAAKKSISVTWTAPDDNGSPITGYTIYYMEKGSDEVNSISVSAETNSYVIEGTKSNTSYTVWMTAENAVGEGEESSRNTVSASITSSGGGGGSTTKVVVATAEPSS